MKKEDGKHLATLWNKIKKRMSKDKEKLKDNLEVEYALQDIHKPIGVSEFNLEKILPDNLKSSLPSIEELEEELKKIDN